MKTFSDLFQAISDLDYGDLRDELFTHWVTFEDNEPVVALQRFDANMGDLSKAANDFFIAWACASADRSFYNALEQAWALEFAGQPWEGIVGDISYAIEVARDNAQVTVYEEKSLPESEWAYCFRASLASHLCDGNCSEEVRNWFASKGVRF